MSITTGGDVLRRSRSRGRRRRRRTLFGVLCKSLMVCFLIMYSEQ